MMNSRTLTSADLGAMLTFSYHLTRDYPQKWLPWLIYIGGICLLCLFSVINLAANGYTPDVQYSTDPNATLSQKHWTHNTPFEWFDKSSSACQSQTLSVNSQFLTDKLSLLYTVTGIWQSRTPDNITVLPSLRYTNNILENCTVNNIVLNFDAYKRTAGQQSFLPWTPEASASITCLVQNGDIPTYFNLSTTYDYLSPTFTGNGDETLFNQLDSQNKAALWWGQSLLSWNYISLAFALDAHTTVTSRDGLNVFWLRSGTFWMTGIQNPSRNITDAQYLIETTKFTCLTTHSDGTFDPRPSNCSDLDNGGSYNSALWPAIYPQADTYTKVFYSSILADLGSTNYPSILTNPNVLQYYTANFSRPNGLQTKYIRLGPASRSYNDLKASTGPLVVTPSRIYQQYFCQVPKRKSTGSLIVAIFVADVVFLQIAWLLLSFIMTWQTERNDPRAKFCVGCLTRDSLLELHDTHPVGHLDTVGGEQSTRYPRGSYKSVSSEISIEDRIGPAEM